MTSTATNTRVDLTTFQLEGEPEVYLESTAKAGDDAKGSVSCSYSLVKSTLGPPAERRITHSCNLIVSRLEAEVVSRLNNCVLDAYGNCRILEQGYYNPGIEYGFEEDSDDPEGSLEVWRDERWSKFEAAQSEFNHRIDKLRDAIRDLVEKYSAVEPTAQKVTDEEESS